MNFEQIFERAATEAYIAAIQHQPNPMVVCGEIIEDGVCGFAWVNIKPGNSKFANWLKANGKAHKAHNGGVSVWIHEFGQSYERKMKFAGRFAEVIRQELPTLKRVVAEGRLD